MAKKIMTLLVDDLDGTELGEKGHTVEFGWLGQSYEIDLSDKNAESMKNDLRKYVEHARRASRPTTTGTRRTRGSAGAPSETKQARAWLIEHGHLSPDARGRISEANWELYRGRGQQTMPEPATESAPRARSRNSRSAEKAPEGAETPESVPA